MTKKLEEREEGVADSFYTEDNVAVSNWFKFDEVVQDDDLVIAKSITEEDDEGEGEGSATVNLLVDPLSFQYLIGAEIDYKEDIEGEQFIIRNPNAKSTCGCGSSFTT